MTKKKYRTPNAPLPDDQVDHGKTAIAIEPFFRQFSYFISERYKGLCTVSTEIVKDTAVTLSPFHLFRLCALLLSEHRAKGTVHFHGYADARTFAITATADDPFELELDPLLSLAALTGVDVAVSPDGRSIRFSAVADILTVLDLYARSVDFLAIFEAAIKDFVN